jgi:hypothetical protein
MKLNVQLDLDTNLGGALALAALLGAGLLFLQIGEKGRGRADDWAASNQSQNAFAATTPISFAAATPMSFVTSTPTSFATSTPISFAIAPATSPAIGITPPVNPPEQLEPNKSVAKINVADKTISNVVHSYTSSEEEQFKDFYIKPAKCLNRAPYDVNTLVACGNDYMRSRSKFRELWVKLHPDEETREEQFKAFYTKPAKCRDRVLYDQDKIATCGDDYIRARAKFEESLGNRHPNPEEARKKAMDMVEKALRDGKYLASSQYEESWVKRPPSPEEARKKAVDMVDKALRDGRYVASSE